MLYSNFRIALELIEKSFIKEATLISTEKWQGIKLPQPMMEQLMVSFRVPMPQNLVFANMDIQPNQPWADEHFEERVGGLPLNPGNTYKIWPFYKMDKEMRTHDEQFSHTYMERFWPRYAGDQTRIMYARKGIRYYYGDLGNVVELLNKEPLTRQAYLPVWFPEDTGVVHGGRVPCTIGYHFIRREGRLHIVYYIRSCDLIRHFRDDIYLAIKLTHWILSKLQILNPEVWGDILMGDLVMHITSLHSFQSDMYNLKKKWKTG